MAEQDSTKSTKATTQAEAREADRIAQGSEATLEQAQEQGYVGFSPEAARVGSEDKGLSQRNPAILNGGPVPDARPTVDDSDAISSLKG